MAVSRLDMHGGRLSLKFLSPNSAFSRTCQEAHTHRNGALRAYWEMWSIEHLSCKRRIGRQRLQIVSLECDVSALDVTHRSY